MAGTFDVENFGDLLFPLIASEALNRRIPVRIEPFSLNARSRASWPFDVRALDELEALLPSVSALLVGGGQLVRFDRTYPVSVPDQADVPLAYWLLPAVAAALAGKPVIWNAVGAWTDSPRAPWYDPLIRETLAASRIVAVRDEASRDWLRRIAPEARMEIVPDTAFGLSRLWPLGDESQDFAHWRESIGLEGRYVLIQASGALTRHRERIAAVMHMLGVSRSVVVPVCPCNGDRLDAFGPFESRLDGAGHMIPPRLLAEIVARSEFLFASSLHACIAAASYGVPAARAWIWRDRKFELLDGIGSVARIEDGDSLIRLAGRGRREDPLIGEYCDRLDLYWDDVADSIVRPAPEVDLSVRAGLERTLGHATSRDREWTRRAVRRLEEAKSEMRNRRAVWRDRLIGWKDRLLGGGRGFRLAAAQAAPLTERRSPVLLLDAIRRHPMIENPYRWAELGGLFSATDAGALAASFPTDNFKQVQGYDGEKGFRYLSRSLIHMGATRPTHPAGLAPIWLALARDLLSAEYREALSAASGKDLSAADMEVNVIHYGPGAWLGPHVDLKEKILTHIFYFNEEWDPADGGCLNILNSRDPADVAAEILPIVGNSSLLVRSDNSWHSVSPVSSGSETSRRSLNVIFHLPGSVSTMWPPRERARLRDYAPAV